MTRKTTSHSVSHKDKTRYQFEIGSEAQVANKQKKKDPAPESLKYDPEATGANISGAFSKIDHEEYASENVVAKEVQAMKQKTKQRFQEDLQQNYNVEFAEDEKIENHNNNHTCC